MRFLLDLRTSPYIVYHIKDSYILNNHELNSCDNQELSNYMSNSETFSLLLDLTNCIISNKEIPHYESLSTDGYWIWSSDLEHYIENFNLKMPSDFIHYLKSIHYKIKPLSKENMETLYFKKFKTLYDADHQIDTKNIKVIQLS